MIMPVLRAMMSDSTGTSAAAARAGVVVVVMGVAGAGKTTVGGALAAALACPFRDADEFHSRENVAKMAAGEPLTGARPEWRLSGVLWRACVAPALCSLYCAISIRPPVIVRGPLETDRR